MPTYCDVPVLPQVDLGTICHFYGYDCATTLPYILQITLEVYGQQPYSLQSGVEGVQYGTVFIPPFSMHPNEVSARIEIDEKIIIKNANGQNAAR